MMLAAPYHAVARKMPALDQRTHQVGVGRPILAREAEPARSFIPLVGHLADISIQIHAESLMRFLIETTVGA